MSAIDSTSEGPNVICASCGQQTSAGAPHPEPTDCIRALGQTIEILQQKLADVQHEAEREQADAARFHAALGGIADLLKPNVTPELLPVLVEQIRQTAESCVKMRPEAIRETGAADPVTPEPLVLREHALKLLRGRLPDLRRLAEGHGTNEDGPLVQAVTHLVLAELHVRLAEEAGRKGSATDATQGFSVTKTEG